MPKKPGLSVGYMIVGIFKAFLKSLARTFGHLMGAMLAGGVIGAMAGAGAAPFYGLPFIISMCTGGILGAIIVASVFLILHSGFWF